MPILVKGSLKLGSSGDGGCVTSVYGGTDLSSEATITDDYSLFPIIRKTNSSSSETNLFTLNIPEIDVGTWSVMIRLRLTNVTNANNVIKLTVNSAAISDEASTKQSIYNIKPTMLTTANEFETVGFVFNMTTKSPSTLQIVASLPTNSVSNTVSVDYVLISPTFTTISAIN